jgi:ethanolamine transporter EutH
MMVLSTIIYGCLIGILLTFSNFIKKVKYINEDLKNVLQAFIVVILVTVLLYVFPYFNLSETVNKLIIFNTVILIIIIIVLVLIYNSIQINKINKKIKE